MASMQLSLSAESSALNVARRWWWEEEGLENEATNERGRSVGRRGSGLGLKRVLQYVRVAR